ncbi:MAG: insulinase family protein [Thermoguttaceae bacterium]|nr:insulinase family protein [Thermoguttaceae bacterium]MDW8077418.1 pitrilysin family protein [Thermoguttaceae bacterium]
MAQSYRAVPQLLAWTDHHRFAKAPFLRGTVSVQLVLLVVASPLLTVAFGERSTRGEQMNQTRRDDPRGQAVAVAIEQVETQSASQDLAGYQSIRRLPKATTLATLHNGLTVIVQENHAAPVATVRCYVRNTGSAFEGKHLGAGISHVLEHVVSGGTTTRRSEKEIEQIIDSIGGASNAFTSLDVTGYYIDCPAKHVFTALELIADAMQRCAFAPEEFERELKVVRQELADGEVNRRRVQWNLLSQILYLEHPARHPIIGYADVLMRTTNEEIIAFYRERYVPNNQVVVVVGDVNTEAILGAVARLWGEAARGSEVFLPMPDEPLPLTPREAWREMDGKTFDLVVAWPTIRLGHPDLYPLDLAAFILTEGESSRLVRKLRYERQLALSVRASSYTPHFVRGWFGIFAVASPETWQEAEAEILKEVYRLREELVTAEELTRAKKQKLTEHLFAQQRVQAAASSLATSFLATGDPLFDDRYVEEIQKVTAEEIRQVAQRYFLPERLCRVVIAPKGYHSPKPETVTSPVEGAVQVHRLSNGLRVLVKRQAHLPIVNVQVYVLGGALVDEPTVAGRASLLAAMLSKGTDRYSAQQIAEFFDSLGAEFSIQAGRNTINATLTVLRDDLPRAMEVLSECMLRSTLPPEEFQKVKQLALQAIARRSDDPHQEIAELLADNLPANSPYHVVLGGKRETVERLTVDDLRQYIRQFFVPENMLVTVFGDIEPEAALKLVESCFGGMAPADKPPEISFDYPNAIPEKVHRHKQTGKETGLVMLAFPGASYLEADRYAALMVLDAVMSGYNYPGGWLHNELRGAGLVYMVHAFQMTGPAPGYLVFIAQTDPGRLSEVIERIWRNIERAKSGDITEEEVATAKQMIVNLRAQEKTTLASQAAQAALDELFGLGHEYDRTFDARIEAVTRGDVVQVAREVFSRNYVLVTTSPAAAQ